ncbi:MAG TPA: hypothetical protein VFX49_04155 [Chloroflexota bacterium]|nr:hypothetical protein [Chloroflexota bacterium]
MQDPRTRAEDRAALLGGARSQVVTLPSGEATIAFAGSESPRERIWVQIDAATDDTAAVLAAWAMVESLLSDRASRHRASVTGRSLVAVVLAPPPLLLEPRGGMPYLDGGTMGAHVPLLRAVRSFAPTLVVHAQDWTGAVEPRPGVRLVESFRIDPSVHAALPPYGHGGRWSAQRRAHARLVDSPDWQWGARVASLSRRLGVPLHAALRGAERERAATVVHELAPGRFTPVHAVRRLGGGNLAELALAETGAHGVTVQMAGGTTGQRASHAMAVAEAAIVHRLNLAAEGVSR